MGDDNVELQSDEIQALSAIYGDEWCVLDEASRAFCIKITDGSDVPRLSVSLQVIFPPDYPLDAPPVYQLNAPWLRGDDRQQLANSLEEIYVAHIGESIVYLWVEKIREFVSKRLPQHEEGGKIHRHITTETDFGDNDSEGSDISNSDIFLPLSLTVTDRRDRGCTCPDIYHGEPLTDRRSTFQAHLAAVTDKEHVLAVLEKLMENKKIAAATHNIVAYRIERGDIVIQGCDDDGETHAGSRMLHLMKLTSAKNAMVVVSRWYGGILLGADRFKHINNCARNILEEHGYIKGNKSDKKDGPCKSSRKAK